MIKKEHAKIGNRIKDQRIARGLTMGALGAEVGVAASTIMRYEQGAFSRLKIPIVGAIAEALNVSPAYLIGKTDDPSPINDAESYGLETIELKKFPLLGEIACGEPIFAEESHESYVMASTEIRADFALVAKGDSMTGARIYDGDIVFIQKMPMVDNGDIAAVIIEDEATLKRVYYYPESEKLLLNPENSNYAPLIYSGDELNQIRVLGKAVMFQSLIK